MSHRTRWTFSADKERSDIDLRRVNEWLTRLTGVCTYIVDEKTHDIIDEYGVTYEHKADRQAHRTHNVAFECYRRGREQWAFTCNADFFIVTTREWVRLYAWKDALQDELLEQMNDGWLQYKKVGGDDDIMDLRCVPENHPDIKKHLCWEEPWDNTVTLTDILAERK